MAEWMGALVLLIAGDDDVVLRIEEHDSGEHALPAQLLDRTLQLFDGETTSGVDHDGEVLVALRDVVGLRRRDQQPRGRLSMTV